MNEKLGIVDVGGGLRDIYGAGIFDYLIDNQIKFKYCLGVSAGSANIASYIAGQKGRNKVFYKEYSFRKEYISLENFRKKGSYIDLDYVYGTLSNEGGEYPLDYDAIAKSDSEMVVVASNARTGKPEYFTKKDLHKNDYGIFCASCCIPVVCKPYRWRGKEYFDGGITDPIPLKKAYEDGCTKVVIIITRPIDYRKSDGHKKIFYKKLRKQYPLFTEKLEQRCELYNETLENIIKDDVKNGKVLILAPDDDLNMKTLEKDKEKLEALYNKGYKDGEKVKKFLVNIK